MEGVGDGERLGRGAGVRLDERVGHSEAGTESVFDSAMPIGLCGTGACTGLTGAELGVDGLVNSIFVLVLFEDIGDDGDATGELLAVELENLKLLGDEILREGSELACDEGLEGTDPPERAEALEPNSSGSSTIREPFSRML